ncbi:L-seryl-tRNA(Sec) selenium transferase [Vagococcus lutrae]|uniref:L-seryl-tRNA(Sec) selenium transferase n=1 Tax=Vagococcus lutrae TaxID=81947 RepID=UPI00288F4E95|nr:L-seryl-tRNA(Sec) selenium transferase [Vagococcus lutrae]MDT2808682.1 L-seryl-tRNA(Sec) selenium transferase [Vagococcus lutrae]
MQEKLRAIPSVNRLLEQPALKETIEKYGLEKVKNIIQLEQSHYRTSLLKGDTTLVKETVEDWAHSVNYALHLANQTQLKKVINATGVILHTNLGRSVLSQVALDKVIALGPHYTNLEYDLKTGTRGSRYDHVTERLKQLTGAEAALVVNNNAAAVLLALHTMSQKQEVVISRGELVEIGGAFRIPEIITLSGAQLREVGTTNKTHLADYQQAITEETGALLKVHTSNYRIEGFTSEVPISELSQLAKCYEIPLITDLGSGLFFDFSELGLRRELTLKEALYQGSDIVTFSGDKLLGGPQAGIIIGKKEWIDAMKRNQLTRALRVDKLTLAMLDATLSLYEDVHQAKQEIPTLNYLYRDVSELQQLAEHLYTLLIPYHYVLDVSIKESDAQVGGGAYPNDTLPSVAVIIRLRKGSLQLLTDYLREYEVPVIGKIHHDHLWLDMKTIEEEELDIIAAAFAQAIKRIAIETQI